MNATKANFLKSIDSLLGPLLCRVFSRPQTSVDYPAPKSLPGPWLVVRPGGIGDAVMLLPMLAALRRQYPERRVDILCESRNRAVFELFDPTLQCFCYDTQPLRTLRHLRRAGYSVVLDSEQFHHFSGALAAWTRATLRIGFKLNAKRNSIYTHLVSYDLDGAEDTQFGRLLGALCGSVPTLPPKSGILARAALPDLPAVTLPPERQHVVVHTGGSVPAKRWPAERYSELCDRLVKEHDLHPVLVGSAADHVYVREIVEGCRQAPINLCGDLSLAQTAQLCRQTKLFVGPDSGIAHLATAVGARAVVLFGPSDPNKWGPGETGEVVNFPVPCGPCAIFGYNKSCRIYACMRGIQVKSVLAAIERLRAGSVSIN